MMNYWGEVSDACSLREGGGEMKLLFLFLELDLRAVYREKPLEVKITESHLLGHKVYPFFCFTLVNCVENF